MKGGIKRISQIVLHFNLAINESIESFLYFIKLRVLITMFSLRIMSASKNIK